jgi:putative endonuclease
MYYTYILECRDKTLYTGITTDLNRRISQHNQRKGAKYFKRPGKIPAKLVYYETFSNRSEASKREYQIKRLKREEKLELIIDKKNNT